MRALCIEMLIKIQIVAFLHLAVEHTCNDIGNSENTACFPQIAVMGLKDLPARLLASSRCLAASSLCRRLQLQPVSRHEPNA